MALSAGTLYEVRSSATSGNVNSGGFNPGNTNGLTNLTTTAGTGNTSSPVVSSASYSFVAGDVNAWLYIQGGTNWTPGWYQIASVATGKATLSAAVGQAIQVSNNRFQTNTVAGCATTGTPTNGTFMVDYSQQNAAQAAFTNLKSTSGSTTLTDNAASNKFTKVMVGNLIHITAGTNFTPGWYEIISWTNANNVVLDSSPHGINTASAGTGKVGGAISLGATGTGIGDSDFSSLQGSTRTVTSNIFIKGNTSYTPGESMFSMSWEGYAAVRGDRPTGTTRPSLNMGSNNVFSGGNIRNLIITAASIYGTPVEIGSVYFSSVHCIETKIVNSSTTPGQFALIVGGPADVIGCELVCYRGIGMGWTAGGGGPCNAIGNYIHDCDIGISVYSSPSIFINNIICGCVTTAIYADTSNAGQYIAANNTLYGAANNLGTAIDLTNAAYGYYDYGFSAMNNIIYGFVTGVSMTTTTQSNYSEYNDYYNNTNDVSSSAGWQKGSHDVALDPQFANVAQLTGSTATTSGSVLTQSGADFSSVVNGQDYLYLVSGTGITAGIYGITAHTTTTLTLDIAPGTDATADKVWQVTTGRNFAISTNLKAGGYPGVFPGAPTTSSLDIGAVQRKEPTLAVTFVGG